MYWQVYLHKTVLAAEKMIVKIIERAREIYTANDDLKLNATLDYFFEKFSVMNDEALEKFCLIDDYDVMFAVKKWSGHNDKVLSILCKGLLNRKLYKCKLQTNAFNENEIEEKRKSIAAKMNISYHEAGYFIFTGEAMNTTYTLKDERINIISKNEVVRDISQVDDPLIHKTLSMPVKKFYICQLV
jgi:HD superfamily phosphohydrolase